MCLKIITKPLFPITLIASIYSLSFNDNAHPRTIRAILEWAYNTNRIPFPFPMALMKAIAKSIE